MTTPTDPPGDPNAPLDAAARRAGETLDELASGPAARAADTMRRAFEETGEAIESALVSAAARGELSFARLGETIAQTFAASLIQQTVGDPLSAAVARVFAGGAPGARADGGPVTPGGAFLVGERGPELFTPATAGQISPAPAGVVVNLTVTGGAGASDLRRSQGQIATAVARAVARGQRNL